MEMNKKLLIWVVFAAFAAISTTAHANAEDFSVISKKPKQEVYELAMEYLSEKRGDLSKAISLLQEASQHGNDEALYALGQIYENGRGNVARNLSEALRYYNESAQLGNGNALYSLSFFVGTGKAVPINKPLSLVYCAFASQGGVLEAEMSLAYKHLMGHNVKKSCDKAAHRYEVVAAKGNLLFTLQIRPKVLKSVVVEELSKDPLALKIPLEMHRLSDASDASSMHKTDEDVIQFYKFSADTGDAEAQVTMGNLYLIGAPPSVTRNFDQAFHYFQQAARQGSAAGTGALGLMYAHGFGINQDNQTALKYLKEAADKGNAVAQTNLGLMYFNGQGVAKSLSEAQRYFKLAADQGYAEGLLRLGQMYLKGEGVKRDYGKAATYFTLAVAQSHVVAMYELARMHHYGMGAQHSCGLAVQFYKRVAERGPWASIMKEAYELYQQGDYDGALLKYERAAEQGYEVAQSNAAWIYDKGLSSLYSDGNTTYRLAFEYFRNSAEQKNAASLLKLGDYYFYGMGTPVNYEKAALYYQAASEMRNAQATFNVGYLHQTGLGLPKDLHLAKRYYDMALGMEPDSYIAIYLALGRLIMDFIYEGSTVYPSLELWGFKWDSVLLALLTSILVLCVVVKQLIR